MDEGSNVRYLFFKHCSLVFYVLCACTCVLAFHFFGFTEFFRGGVRCCFGVLVLNTRALRMSCFDSDLDM